MGSAPSVAVKENRSSIDKGGSQHSSSGRNLNESVTGDAKTAKNLLKDDEDEGDGDDDDDHISFKESERIRRAYRIPSQILEHLFVGTYAQSCDHSMLREKGIKYLLSLKGSSRVPPRDFRLCHLPVSDYGRTHLPTAFKTAFPFIDRAISEKAGVLIFCSQGVNRAPTMTLGYLMYSKRWPMKECYEYVRSKRPQASPHEKYFDQLMEYELSLFGSNSYNVETRPESLQEYMRKHIIAMRLEAQNDTGDDNAEHNKNAIHEHNDDDDNVQPKATAKKRQNQYKGCNFDVTTSAEENQEARSSGYQTIESKRSNISGFRTSNAVYTLRASIQDDANRSGSENKTNSGPRDSGGNSSMPRIVMSLDNNTEIDLNSDPASSPSSFDAQRIQSMSPRHPGSTLRGNSHNKSRHRRVSSGGAGAGYFSETAADKRPVG
mmetsp:Transcript_3355/g.7868  ORF Transcript_3355/g.7868 Transcript_3355/m.7868 type:complete len:434 (-) Transcript_3355:211-1512(-)|eukprot:CAMPEP_0114499628 /NCGR_PEP_ID=MMETSP0109-20121206/7522_1 /TAXON_ID=29199 /ORGANISM="Chlorarachnion reptans, Strain CCCM449" /LENGTH=433 /DNA_ID=CAMNT_0001677215 /DNA_START=11 /DNA_END=1312 /DNA_ORIENTATION=+